MPTRLDSSQFRRLLDKRLREVAENRYKELTSMIPKIYRVIKTDKLWEEFYSIGALGDVEPFNGQITYKSISPGYHNKIETSEFALGVQAERKLIDAKQYPVLDNFAGSLMEAAHRTREKIGVEPFAYGFSSAFTFQTSEEGKAVFSSSHTTKSGTSTSSGFDNAGTSAMSKTSVAATRILMRQFRNDISERIYRGDNLALIYPDNLDDTAREINGTSKGLDTAEGNINTQFGRYTLIPYLRLDDYDSNNWFMVDLDMMKHDLVWIDRILPETAHTYDFNTMVLMSRVYYACANGTLDWRWGMGHQVS